MIASKYQKAIYRSFLTTDENINISAVAGSGKTTVLVHLLNFVKKSNSALFLAFNKSVVNELKDRIKQRENVEVMTVHSYGWRCILSRYGSYAKISANKSLSKIERAMKLFPKVDENKKGWYFYIITQIVDLLRCNLLEPSSENIDKISEHYNLNVSPLDAKIAKKVFELMDKDKRNFDFMDMIYQPIADGTIRQRKYDYVFCDECQDFSVAQQNLIKNALNRKGRLITVGDPRQAIYGFCGADSNSYSNLSTINGESLNLPLSVSYRCAKNIVLEAKNIVPEISYSKNAKDGIVREGSLMELEDGDWILCRNLKPLVQTCLWLMKNKVKSKIRGKDIGEGILALVSKTGSKTLKGLSTELIHEKDKLFNKLTKRGVSHPSLHPKMEDLNEKIEVIECLMSEVNSIQTLKTLISNIFSDEIKGILLSTIHKAKGLENDKVFFLCPDLIPSKYATQDWQLEQEQNLKYVAITRAKSTLIYVKEFQFIDDLKRKFDYGRN